MVKRLFSLILPVFALGAILFWRFYSRPALPPSQLPQINQAAEPSPSPIPMAITVIPGQSADGKISLKLTQKPGRDSIGWQLAAATDNQPPQTIWQAVLPLETKVSLPFNAVSPDNKYLFIQQSGLDQTGYLVMTTSGQPLPKGDDLIDFAPLFAERYPEYRITEATGWGGINLIVFNTDSTKGGRGPSFWYEIPTGAFIRLNNRFD